MSILPWHSDQGKQWSLKWRKPTSTKRAEVSVACFHSTELGVGLGVSNCITTINNRKYSFVNSENTFKLYLNRNQRTSLFEKTEFPRTAQSSWGRCENRSSTYQPRAPLYRLCFFLVIQSVTALWNSFFKSLIKIWLEVAESSTDFLDQLSKS